MFEIFPPDRLSASVGELRALTFDDWPLEQALSREADVVRWTMYPPDLDDDAARARAQRTVDRAAAGDAKRYVVVVDDQAIGTAAIFVPDDGTPEIAYALLPVGRGRGAATAAAIALSDWAFAAGYVQVRLWTIFGNDASEAVAARAGFAPVRVGEHPQRGRSVEVKGWIRRREGPVKRS